MFTEMRKFTKKLLGGFVGELPKAVDQNLLIAQAANYFQMPVEQVRQHYETYRQLHVRNRYTERFGERKTFCFEEAFLFYLAVLRLKPANIVEIGPYSGKSTRRIIDLLHFLELETKITCFDIEDNLQFVERNEVSLVIKDVTNDFINSVLTPISPDLIFFDARPYHLLHNVISEFVRWSQSHQALLAIHDCSPGLYNPTMRLAKDQPELVSSKTGVWERHVLAEVFAESPTALDDVRTPSHRLRIFETPHGLAMIAPWTVLDAFEAV